MFGEGVILAGIRFSIVDLMKAGAALEAKIKSLGVSQIELHDEVSTYEQSVSHSDKGYIGEYFHRTLNTLPPSMFQGVTCRSSDGKVVATTAVRCDDISGWDLDRYIREFWMRAYRTEDGEPVRLSDAAVPFAKDITGSIAYIGDTFVSSDFRANNLAAYIVRLCLVIANTKWRPVYTYGWMARHHAFEKALFLRWGYTTCYAGGLTWERPPANKAYEDLCFLGCTPAGIAQLLKRPLDIGLDEA